MNQEPLLSPEIFDYLRKLKIEPYTKLDDSAREQLGDGVRVMLCHAGESFSTNKAGLRISVLSGKIRLEPDGVLHDHETTRIKTVLTQNAGSQLQAVEDTVLVLADVEFLDTLSSWAELKAHAMQSCDREVVQRLLSVKQSVAFRRLPLDQVLEALRRMKPRQVKAGEDIVKQGEPGDAFYLIWSGQADVWQSDIYDDAQKVVATIGPRDAFGDEALVVGGNRNATVRMTQDGELLVLGKDEFKELVASSMVEEVSSESVPMMIKDGWRIVDVRYEEEFEDGHIPEAIHLPLPNLRNMAKATLTPDNKYLTVCLSGKRSSIAAFLLKQRGYQVVSMKGGMSVWQGDVAC